ncbi:hypothetical protein GQ53DRAFT_742143 [Thozetella sp. PMI_491]|nr:hypothetical protein GQ53DRAFT_742143 [Thozetella sp. PMI_491]
MTALSAPLLALVAQPAYPPSFVSHHSYLRPVPDLGRLLVQVYTRCVHPGRRCAVTRCTGRCLWRRRKSRKGGGQQNGCLFPKIRGIASEDQRRVQ